MKIAIIGSRGYPYVYSGYETFVKELSERIVHEGCEVTVYCHKNLFTSYPESVKGIKLVYLWTIEKKSLSQFVHSFQAMLHACFCNYDIVLVVNSANGPFGIFTKVFGIRTAINVDGLEWLRPKWKGLGAKYFYWASKLSTKLYDQVITDSFEMQKIYQREFGADSAVIAYGATIRESKNPELIQRWGLQKDDYYLIVGRLVPDNNADVIIREFVKSDSRKKLVVIGDVPYNDAYAQRVKSMEDPRLIFTGYVSNGDELAEFYHNCFAYFHGHEFGGTNPTMLKALAYGCAIIALNTVFNHEMLNGNEYGLFFDKSPGHLAALIHQVETGAFQLDVYKSKARKRILDNYTWEKITNQYLSLFKNMMRP
jgi:glycosyltransferase involved in cell wall biosynthesis